MLATTATATVVDLVDNCVAWANADQRDGDVDGIGDACDDDLDNDGMPNTEDVCPLVYDRDQFDRDGDGLGDECDFCPDDAGGAHDLDGDGHGDECDDDKDGDKDGDSVANDVDNCPTVANAVQIDTDHDGSGDACDGLFGAAPFPIDVVLNERDGFFQRYASGFDPCFAGICDRERALPPIHGGLVVVSEQPVYARVLDGDGSVLAFAGPGLELPLEWVTPNGMRGTPTIELWREEARGELRTRIIPWR